MNDDPTPDANFRPKNALELALYVPTWIAAFFLFLLMCMTFADVIMRSALNNPIESATELTRLFMAIIVFAALPLTTWKGENIIVDLMDPLFSAKLAKIRDIAIDLICGGLLLWPSYRVWQLAERARGMGDVTEYLYFPQYLTGWFIALFSALTAVTFILRGIARILGKEVA